MSRVGPLASIATFSSGRAGRKPLSRIEETVSSHSDGAVSGRGERVDRETRRVDCSRQKIRRTNMHVAAIVSLHPLLGQSACDVYHVV